MFLSLQMCIIPILTNSRLFRVGASYSVEVTPVVVLPVVHLAESDYPLMDGGYAQHPRFSSPSALVVRPSKSNNYSGRNKADSAKPRIYFSEINAFLNSIRSNLLGSTVSITVTITNVFTRKRGLAVTILKKEKAIIKFEIRFQTGRNFNEYHQVIGKLLRHELHSKSVPVYDVRCQTVAKSRLNQEGRIRTRQMSSNICYLFFVNYLFVFYLSLIYIKVEPHKSKNESYLVVIFRFYPFSGPNWFVLNIGRLTMKEGEGIL